MNGSRQAGGGRRAAVVAIDGPSGSGKSSVARAIAARLGFVYLDTGAMYRAVGLLAHEAGVSPDDDDAVTSVAARADLRVTEDGRMYAGERDLSTAIRTLAAGDLASRVSVLPGVRRSLAERQRALAGDRGVVMEGRDIGTNVFPGATVKIYLTANPDVRAERRLRQLRAAGHDVTSADVLADVRGRDRRDSGRAVAPLRCADDAVVIDSTGLTLDEVVAVVEEVVRRRLVTREGA